MTNTAQAEGSSPLSADRPPTLEFREATKLYGRGADPAVDKLSLTVEAGEICVLVGPSGCGKTTAMRMVNRMIDLTERRHPARRRAACATRPDRAAARDRLRDPADRAVPAPDDRRQHRHRAAAAGLGQGRIRDARRRAARARRPRARRCAQPLPGAALGRPAPARRRRPRARRRPAADADGRAVRRHRPDQPRAPPGRVPAPAGARCARRSSSSPTTSTRPSRWATGSRSCARAATLAQYATPDEILRSPADDFVARLRRRRPRRSSASRCATLGDLELDAARTADRPGGRARGERRRAARRALADARRAARRSPSSVRRTTARRSAIATSRATVAGLRAASRDVTLPLAPGGPGHPELRRRRRELVRAREQRLLLELVQRQLGRHVLSGLRRAHRADASIAVAIGFAIAFALALVAHRRGGSSGPFTIVTGVLYTIPSLALFQLLVPSPA